MMICARCLYYIGPNVAEEGSLGSCRHHDQEVNKWGDICKAYLPAVIFFDEDENPLWLRADISAKKKELEKEDE